MMKQCLELNSATTSDRPSIHIVKLVYRENHLALVGYGGCYSPHFITPWNLNAVKALSGGIRGGLHTFSFTKKRVVFRFLYNEPRVVFWCTICFKIPRYEVPGELGTNYDDESFLRTFTETYVAMLLLSPFQWYLEFIAPLTTIPLSRHSSK